MNMMMGLFSIPLILFIIFVMPLWVWMHYRSKRDDAREYQNTYFSEPELKRIDQLVIETRHMRERIEVLENLLDAQHPTWRNR